MAEDPRDHLPLHAWKLGWSGEHGDLRPNQVLFWKVIQWAKERGFETFDFVGVDRDAAVGILEGRHFSEVATGPSYFKLMFGGKVVLLHPAYAFLYNPLVRVCYRTLGSWARKRPLFHRLVHCATGFVPVRSHE